MVEAVRQEMAKLLLAGFIREVKYPDWVSNVVMVKKVNGRWRISQIHELMDAFLGYNQILLDQDDQEKTTFITEERLFCYRVMPFGLKNIGATYLRGPRAKLIRDICNPKGPQHEVEP
ncbi:uncharacterized protein LOC108472227 [Gossypium arboreum]|uniref:uncharacterized protein LOC108472227 n=1 Tax=Gossypium arboreum TaxID=29729 RepID=UPI0008195F8E|nr:uncharacterized protein LOC108472227 [Gossypium arboreum]